MSENLPDIQRAQDLLQKIVQGVGLMRCVFWDILGWCREVQRDKLYYQIRIPGESRNCVNMTEFIRVAMGYKDRMARKVHRLLANEALCDYVSDHPMIAEEVGQSKLIALSDAGIRESIPEWVERAKSCRTVADLREALGVPQGEGPARLTVGFSDGERYWDVMAAIEVIRRYLGIEDRAEALHGIIVEGVVNSEVYRQMFFEVREAIRK